MLLTINQAPTEQEWQFFREILTANDHLLITAAACYLATLRNPTAAQGLIRECELAKLGLNIDTSWQSISEAQWATLLFTSEQNVEWA